MGIAIVIFPSIVSIVTINHHCWGHDWSVHPKKWSVSTWLNLRVGFSCDPSFSRAHCFPPLTISLFPQQASDTNSTTKAKDSFPQVVMYWRPQEISPPCHTSNVITGYSKIRNYEVQAICLQFCEENALIHHSIPFLDECDSLLSPSLISCFTKNLPVGVFSADHQLIKQQTDWKQLGATSEASVSHLGQWPLLQFCARRFPKRIPRWYFNHWSQTPPT